MLGREQLALNDSLSRDFRKERAKLAEKSADSPCFTKRDLWLVLNCPLRVMLTFHGKSFIDVSPIPVWL